MNRARIAKMTQRVAEAVVGDGSDDPLVLVDQAVDMMIRCVQIINENLPKIETESVPQRAALDESRSLLDEGIAPYLADMAKAMDAFAD